jgi:hypothetical protein
VGADSATYFLNQSIVRCQAGSAAALLYRSGVASQLKPCRRAAINEIFTEDSVFYEPSGHAQGHGP